MDPFKEIYSPTKIMHAILVPIHTTYPANRKLLHFPMLHNLYKSRVSPLSTTTRCLLTSSYLSAPASHPMALQPTSGLGLLYSWGSVTAVFYGVGLLAPRPTPNLEDQVSVFMTPGDRVAQLYPRALGSSGTSGVPLPVSTIVGP
jgi:hypothetical protein